MRRFITLIFILFIVEVNTQAQSCLPEGITFTTQAQIDSFQVDYPGCTEIEGDVTIEGDDIVNLNGLNVLTHIGGDLNIGWDFNDFPLTSLIGLESLTSIGGTLEIFGTTELSSLTGLNNLTTIGNSLYISFTEALQDLSGLESLETVGNDLAIHGDDDLMNLTGINNLTHIGGNLFISFNHILEDISGLENLNFVGGSLEISSNDWLNSLTGLENIDAASVHQLTICRNSELYDCDIQSICEYLASPNGAINIYRNHSGCNNPSEIAGACGVELSCLPFGNYYFLTQADIDNFQANYPDCSELVGYVEIGGSNIHNLYGLNSVSTIEGNVMINNNDSLCSLSGLDSLNYIEGRLSIGYWEGIYNQSLTSLNGLEGLDSIGGNLEIIRNPVLVSLAGLTNLTSLRETLTLIENDSLRSLAGLDNINPTFIHGLHIDGNSSLSICEIQSVCDYLAIPGGWSYIGNNAAGCNSPEEVIAACEVGLDEPTVVYRQSSISIYPNPSSNVITIELLSNKPMKNTFLTIYYLSGQELSSYRFLDKQMVLDVSALPKGIFLVKVKDDRTVEVGKFVKQ